MPMPNDHLSQDVVERGLKEAGYFIHHFDDGWTFVRSPDSPESTMLDFMDGQIHRRHLEILAERLGFAMDIFD